MAGHFSASYGGTLNVPHALNHWDGLVQFLDDGRIDIDTNAVERSNAPGHFGQKDSLFA